MCSKKLRGKRARIPLLNNQKIRYKGLNTICWTRNCTIASTSPGDSWFTGIFSLFNRKALFKETSIESMRRNFNFLLKYQRINIFKTRFHLNKETNNYVVKCSSREPLLSKYNLHQKDPKTWCHITHRTLASWP